MSLRTNLRPTEYCENLKQKLVDQKLVRKQDIELKEALENVFIVIDMINALDEDTVRIMDHDLDDIVILSELSDMIYPEVVRVDATSRRCKDIVYRQNLVPEDKRISYTEFMESQALIRSAYRRDDNESMVKVSTLRVKKNLSEILDRIVFCDFNEDGTIKSRMVNQPKGQAFYPIYVSSDVVKSLYHDSYFTDDMNLMLDDLYISKSFK